MWLLFFVISASVFSKPQDKSNERVLIVYLFLVEKRALLFFYRIRAQQTVYQMLFPTKILLILSTHNSNNTGPTYLESFK